MVVSCGVCEGRCMGGLLLNFGGVVGVGCLVGCVRPRESVRGRGGCPFVACVRPRNVCARWLWTVGGEERVLGGGGG